MTADRRVRLQVGGQVREVAVARDGSLMVAGAGGPVVLQRLDRTTFAVRIGTRNLRVRAVADDGCCWAVADGCTFRFEVVAAADDAAAGSGPAASDAVLTAPMPGTVTAVRAAPGQAVERDDPLVVLEAMKMELTIRAPRDGVVESTCCRPGDLVRPGAPLVRLRPPAAGSR